MTISGALRVFGLKSLCLFVLPGVSMLAATYNLGLLTMDTLIPGNGPGAPGVNVIKIVNLTGDPGAGGSALLPDFTVDTPVTLTNSKLTLVVGGVSSVIDLGTLTPGIFSPPFALRFPDTTQFDSVTFSGTLNTTSLLLSGGQTVVADSAQITASIAPSGRFVQPGTDFALITATSAQGLRFVPLTPCRIADTRNAVGSFGGPGLSNGEMRSFTIPDSACNVPPTAQAYSLNVAVVPAGPLGYLTLWPASQTRPVTSTLNSLDGRIKSNAAIVPAGPGGAINVFASNASHVILDVNGYFVSAADTSALAFYPVTPCRIADTRRSAAPLGGPSLAGSETRTFPVLSSTCNIPTSARAYSLNLTAVPLGPLGYITAWPTGQAQPGVASLNALTGTATANAVIVPAGTGGDVDIFATNTTHLVIDINGYFAPPGAGGLSLYNVTPCRVADTRQPPGTPPFTGQKDLAIAGGSCGLPMAAAYVTSATVVPAGPLGFLTLWPQGHAQPGVATLNAIDGIVTSNLALVPASSGNISAFVSNPSHLIVDAFAYFAP